jgi:hypothetical protein
MEHQSIEKFQDFSVGIIEISDDGTVNPTQKERALDFVKEELEGGGLLVVLVHGWHHGPRVCDRDLACFRSVLGELHKARTVRTNQLNQQGKTVGLYIGWRGESCPYRGLNLATIWGRKKVAEHIGRTAGKEIFNELDRLWTDNDNFTMVTVGHSLGGAFVFSAVKGRLTGNISDIELGKVRSYRIVRTESDREEAAKNKHKALRAGFGDLMVLVNPAIEASEYKMFDNDLIDNGAPKEHADLVRKGLPYDKHDPYDLGQFPVLMTVASTADTAVGRIFPVARWIQALSTFHWRYFYKSYWTGMGRYAPHVTHTLNYPKSKEDPSLRKPMSPSCGCSESYAGVPGITPGILDMNSSELQDLGELVFDIAPHRRKRGWDVNSPYLVVEASPGVISEHSDIFNPVFVGFLREYIGAYERKQVEEGERVR